LAYTRAQLGGIPSEIAALVGKKYTVTVTPSSKSLDGDYNYFQVKKVQPLLEMATLALLSVGTSSMPQGDAQCSFSETTSTDIYRTE
jgi:hypothetical protein